LTYEGDYHPSKEGASIPATIQNSFNLLDGLLEVLSKTEGWDSIKAHISSKITD
jgi:hypothetical protein